MAVDIGQLKLSFVWVETFLNILDAAEPKNYPFGFFGRTPSYRDYYQKISTKSARPGNLEFPWPASTRKHFWLYYLEAVGVRPEEMLGNQAWNVLIPFRRRVAGEAKAEWLGPVNKILLESYFYPFGVGLVVTAHLQDQVPLSQAVEWAHKVRHTGKFDFDAGDGNPVQVFSLLDLANVLLGHLKQQALGVEPGLASHRSIEPFTLATVIQGQGVDPQAEIPDQGDIHRTLEGLVSWRATWQADALPPIDQRKLEIKTSPKGHTLYGDQNGQVVWLPGLFSQPSTIPLLASYHRNLLLASVHTQSLSSFLKQTSVLFHGGQNLKAIHRWAAEKAYDLLGGLYSGKDTYKSFSARAQITPYLADIQAFGAELYFNPGKYQ